MVLCDVEDDSACFEQDEIALLIGRYLAEWVERTVRRFFIPAKVTSRTS